MDHDPKIEPRCYFKPETIHIVVPAKSDSDIMFVYKVIRDLESIDHLFINPTHTG